MGKEFYLEGDGWITDGKSSNDFARDFVLVERTKRPHAQYWSPRQCRIVARFRANVYLDCIDWSKLTEKTGFHVEKGI